MCSKHCSHFHNGEIEKAQSTPDDDPNAAPISHISQTKRKRPIGMDYDEIAASEERRAQLRRSREKSAKREKVIELEDEPSTKVARIFGPILEGFRGKQASSSSLH